MFEPWAEKYKPHKLSEVVGQPQAIQWLSKWADFWRRGKPEKPAALLYGPAGTGKTSAAVALARELGWDLIELNASDKRTFDIIQKVAGTAATTGTLLAGATGKRLVVLDEVDNVYGTADRGGYRAIENVLKQATNPVLLIANDQYSIPWTIRGLCFLVNFRRLTQESIFKTLERICKSENIEAESLAINIIAEAAQGDLRSAINDLQAVAIGRRHLTIKDVVVYRRDKEVNIFEVLGQLMQATSARQARALLWALDRPPKDAIDWISENIPRMLTEPADLERAYEALSHADIFLGHIRRRQSYGMMGYAGDMMTAGVALSRQGELKHVRFQAPSSGVLMGRTRATRAVRDSVAKKIAKRCHTSSREARKHFLPYMNVIFRCDKNVANRIAEELELEDGEINYLAGV